VSKDRYVIYDLECLSNFFSATFMDYQSDKHNAFVIHGSRNDVVSLIQFLRQLYKRGYTLVGYNCNNYDNQLIEFLARNFSQFRHLSGDKIAEAIYHKSQSIINLQPNERWNKLVHEWDFTIPHIDIFKQKHYDGKQKSCSLKWLEFTMRLPNIKSMPIPHYAKVETQKQINDILGYNYNDVYATKKSFIINKFETDLRIKLSAKYDLHLLNASEPKLAREIFGHKLADKMEVEYRDLKDWRSERDWIKTSEIIFPYIKFRDPLLQGALDFFKGLEFCPSNFKLNNYDLQKVFKTFKYANLPEVVIGLGGLHACVNPGVYESNPEWEIRDLDGKSFYPNIGIKNRLYPEHLSEDFCDIYEEIYEERKVIPKIDPVNYVYKIILNGTYGQSKESHNFFFDPKYTFSITVNGQLLLLKLAEILRERVPGIMFYQFNTDGITVGYHPKYRDKVEAAMKLWEKGSRIELEDKFYSKMVIMDVNNYIAVDTKGKKKRKGSFAYSMDPADNELDYHKNPSALIVPKALEKYFLEDIPIENTIRECNDIYDFCIGVKIKRDFDLIRYHYEKEKNRIIEDVIHEQVCRFYVSKEYSSLKKRYKAGTKKEGENVELAAKFNVTLFNEYQEKKMSDYKINYFYYIQRARKVINEICPNAENLKMF
jgi:hypothetical protein